MREKRKENKPLVVFVHLKTRMADQLDCALDLMRRMPPSAIEDNLSGLIDVVPDLTEQLLSMVDQPLKVAHDSEARRDYLLCDYNRDGDSYRFNSSLYSFSRSPHLVCASVRLHHSSPSRSPWTNKYDPPLSDGAVPSQILRNIEVQANEIFDIYRDLYVAA